MCYNLIVIICTNCFQLFKPFLTLPTKTDVRVYTVLQEGERFEKTETRLAGIPYINVSASVYCSDRRNALLFKYPQQRALREQRKHPYRNFRPERGYSQN